MQNKANSPRGKMNAKLFAQRDYENKTGFAGQQNKPKQSQFQDYAHAAKKWQEKDRSGGAE
jgi:hypothetical protein